MICRMEFEVGEDVKVLPCKHLFHPACVDRWLHINKVSLLTIRSEHPALITEPGLYEIVA